MVAAPVFSGWDPGRSLVQSSGVLGLGTRAVGRSAVRRKASGSVKDRSIGVDGMTRTANVSTGPRVWLRRLVLTGAAVAVATQLSGYDLLLVAAVSALMVATVKGLQLEVSRSRRKAIGGREPLAPALPARARGTASPAMSVAVSTSDTEPSQSLRVLRSPDVGDSGTSTQTTSPEPAGRDPKPAVPGSQRGRLTRRRGSVRGGRRRRTRT